MVTLLPFPCLACMVGAGAGGMVGGVVVEILSEFIEKHPPDSWFFQTRVRVCQMPIPCGLASIIESYQLCKGRLDVSHLNAWFRLFAVSTQGSGIARGVRNGHD